MSNSPSDPSKGQQPARAERATPPDLMSEPCHSFFTEHQKLNDYFHFVTFPYLNSAQRIRELVQELTSNEKDKARYAKDLDSADEIEGALLSYLPLLYEMLLCRAVDSYINYLAGLLALIFRTRPETLRSGAQERLDFILQHSTM